MLRAVLSAIAPHFARDWYHRALSLAGAMRYGFPSRRMVVIGVTGTKGKTSTVHFIAKLLEGTGRRVGVVSGLYFKVGDREEVNDLKMTMPGRFFIQKKLRAMVDAGCTVAVVEVTSEGIAQHRHRHIDFDVAVFTNIAPEHLEAHGSFAAYLAEKLKLFASLVRSRRIKYLRGKGVRVPKVIVVNGDDAHADEVLAAWADRKIVCHLGPRQGEDPELTPAEHLIADVGAVRWNGSDFTVGGVACTLSVAGRFNVLNALLAIAVGVSQGESVQALADALKSIKDLPGRMEYCSGGRGVEVVVDYAHTPDSLLAVLKALRETHPAGRLVCVMGAAGGGRDKWKRPVLGAVAGAWADEVIVTNEDPYDENPLSIIEAVAAGVGRDDLYQKHLPGERVGRNNEKAPNPRIVPDRRDAIAKALAGAKPGDVVLVAGKGAEPVMAVAGGKKAIWDDRVVVREALARLQGL